MASIATTCLFNSEYVCGLYLVYQIVTPSFNSKMLLLIGYPIYELTRDCLLPRVLGYALNKVGRFVSTSTELLWWEEEYILRLQGTICQALASAAVLFHVATDLIASEYGYATPPTLRCRLACLSMGECLKGCEDVMPERLAWATILVCFDVVGAIVTIIMNRRSMMAVVNGYFIADERGKSGKEEAGYAPHFLDVGNRKSEQSASAEFIVEEFPQSEQDNGQYGQSYGSGKDKAEFSPTKELESIDGTSVDTSTDFGNNTWPVPKAKSRGRNSTRILSSLVFTSLSIVGPRIGRRSSSKVTGPYGHPYTHLPPRILDFNGDVDRFTSYHFWRTRYWIFLMIAMPLPLIYNTQYHTLIPTGVTRAPDGLYCQITDSDAESADPCYVKVPWFPVDEVMSTE